MIPDLSQVKKQYYKNNSRLKVAIVRSNYHARLTKSLETACREYLTSCGVKEDRIAIYEVPGSWEIPLVAKNIARSKKFDAMIALGVIVKGDTYHFELIANECARALMNISLEFNIPVTFEVLATYSLKQAEKRSMGKYNKGIEAAKTLLDTIKILNKV